MHTMTRIFKRVADVGMPNPARYVAEFGKEFDLNWNEDGNFTVQIYGGDDWDEMPNEYEPIWP
jgi:hypothetical protein